MFRTPMRIPRGIGGVLFVGLLIVGGTIGFVVDHLVASLLVVSAAVGGYYYLQNQNDTTKNKPAVTQPQAAEQNKAATSAPTAKPQVTVAPDIKKEKETAAPVKPVDLKALEISATECKVMDKAPAAAGAFAVTYEFNKNAVTYSLPGAQKSLAFKDLTDAEKDRADQIVRELPFGCRVDYFKAKSETEKKTGIAGLKRAVGL